MKTEYSGSMLYRGGTVYKYRAPNHQNTAAIPIATMASLPQTIRMVIGSGEHMTTDTGVDENELTFPTPGQGGALDLTSRVYPFGGNGLLTNVSIPFALNNGSFSGYLQTAFPANAQSLDIRVTTPGFDGNFYPPNPPAFSINAAGNLYVVDPTSATTAFVGGAWVITVNYSTPLGVVLDIGTLCSNTYGFNSTCPIDVGGAPSVAWFQPSSATAAQSATFVVNGIVHLEYIGSAAASLLTPSHSDPVGFSRVNNVAQSLSGLQAADPKKSLKELAFRSLKNSLMDVIPGMVDIVTRSTAGTLGGMIMGGAVKQARRLALTNG